MILMNLGAGKEFKKKKKQSQPMLILFACIVIQLNKFNNLSEKVMPCEFVFILF